MSQKEIYMFAGKLASKILVNNLREKFFEIALAGAMGKGVKTIRAIYEHGVFIPTEPVELPEASEVELEARPATEEATVERKLARISRILSGRVRPGEADPITGSP